ncbi:MAG: divergent PAP2 family protein [Eubacterium sp.]|nr:divergent PAP2 family protein [Eubacterium sp.]
MEIIYEIISNKILINGIIAWAVAQVLKTLIHAGVNRRFDWHRLFGDGGMPSGHSATVTSMAATAAYECGFGSPVFALSAMLATIVMKDAMGVRLETGKQAKIINEITNLLDPEEPFSQQHLKEFVGHTPLQVFFGAVLGIIVAIWCR